MADVPHHQSSIHALNTITPNLVDLLADLIFGRSPPIEHRCLEYRYTKLGRSHVWHICLADLPPKLSIDALNTITPNVADLLADLIFGRYTPCQSSIDALNTITPILADLPGRCTPYQLSIHALHTITPNLADLLADLIFGRSTPLN